MKKILAVSLISIMALTVFTSCESAKVTDASVTTEITEEEASDTTSTTSTTTEETTEPTTEVTTTETEITTVPTEISYLYDFENRPVSVNWDKLGDKPDTSVNSMFKRLSEDPILVYEPGTANGCILPFTGSLTERILEYDEASTTNSRIGFVDPLGTIVCDPVYSHVATWYSRIYITEREYNGTKYVGLIYKDGSKSVEVPYSFYQTSNDFVYIHNSETGTLQIYDLYCNMVAESPRLTIQLN